MKVKFKPVCGKCGSPLKELEYKKGPKGAFIQPPVCPECGERITQIELPSISDEGFVYKEESESNGV